MAGIDAFALLQEDMKSEEIQDQIQAAKRIATIAHSMGVEKTKSQLVPYLMNVIEEQSDEILLALAESMPTLVPALGTNGENANLLLAPLEALAEKDETVVRAKAVISLEKIGKVMQNKALQQEMLPLVKRLAAGENFPSRVSAAGLFATVYGCAPPEIRQSLRKQYETLSKDEMPMVRSAAFAHLPKLAKVVEKDVLRNEIVPIFNELAADVQESVREMAVTNLVAMVEQLTTEELPPEDAANLFGTFSDNLQTERASTIRLLKAQNFVSLAVAMDHSARPLRGQTTPFLQLLLHDTDLEVRTAAAKNLGAFCARLDGITIQSQILPELTDICQPPPPGEISPNQPVREHVADNICSLATKLGRDSTMNDLMRLLRMFLSDEAIEIKRKVLGTIAPVVEALGGEATQSALLPEVIRMSSDPQWRVRLAIVQTIPVYAKHLGVDVFGDGSNTQNTLKDIQISALADPVARIREAAVENLQVLSKDFGSAWVSTNILPWVKEAAKGSGPATYLGRMTALHATEYLLSEPISSPDKKAVADELMSVVMVPLSKDRISNVRIAAAAALKNVAVKLVSDSRGFVDSVIKPVIQELVNDTDPDVKYLAESAMAV